MKRKRLNSTEEKTLRVLMRLLTVLPRSIDNDMHQRAGLGLTKYLVLMSLSEAPDRRLRMSDLAAHMALSPSRMTRVVTQLEQDGLIERLMNAQDRRSNVAHLTSAGLQRLQDAWPAHLAAVRVLIFDHIDAAELPDLLRMLSILLEAAEDQS